MFRFPPIEPEIKITDLPGEEFEVACRDAQSYFVLLELGAENEFSFYDYPTKAAEEKALVFKGAHRLKVTRRIQIDGFEALEIQMRYAEAGSDYEDAPTTFYHVLNDGNVLNMSIQDSEGGTWRHEKSSRIPLPVDLRPGLRVQGKEPLYTVERPEQKIIDWLFEVIGAAQVSIGPKVYRCLKVYWSSSSAEQNVLAEYYVADTGRTVFFRRYNGPRYRNYEELAGKPMVEYEGTVWRHWYDCLPDHALVIGL